MKSPNGTNGEAEFLKADEDLLRLILPWSVRTDAVEAEKFSKLFIQGPDIWMAKKYRVC